MSPLQVIAGKRTDLVGLADEGVSADPFPLLSCSLLLKPIHDSASEQSRLALRQPSLREASIPRPDEAGDSRY